MIVTTCPRKPHNGVWRHLKELEDTTLMTVHIPSQDLKNGLPDGTEMVIFGGGWIGDYEKINKIAITNGIKTGLLFCSPFGQADLCNENHILMKVCDMVSLRHINYLFTGDIAVAEVFKRLLGADRVNWLPQTLNIHNFKFINKPSNTIGLFCNANVNKNILNQLVAVSLVKNHYLITNALTDNYRRLANELNINYDRYDWLSDIDYQKLISSVGVGLQVSWSEAFDYVAAEMSLQGIPVVTGNTIYWNLPELKVVDSDNPLMIKNALDFCYGKITTKAFRKKVRDNILKELEIRRKITIQLFNKLLGYDKVIK